MPSINRLSRVWTTARLAIIDWTNLLTITQLRPWAFWENETYADRAQRWAPNPATRTIMIRRLVKQYEQLSWWKKAWTWLFGDIVYQRRWLFHQQVSELLLPAKTPTYLNAEQAFLAEVTERTRWIERIWLFAADPLTPSLLPLPWEGIWSNMLQSLQTILHPLLQEPSRKSAQEAKATSNPFSLTLSHLFKALKHYIESLQIKDQKEAKEEQKISSNESKNAVLDEQQQMALILAKMIGFLGFEKYQPVTLLQLTAAQESLEQEQKKLEDRYRCYLAEGQNKITERKKDEKENYQWQHRDTPKQQTGYREKLKIRALYLQKSRQQLERLLECNSLPFLPQDDQHRLAFLAGQTLYREKILSFRQLVLVNASPQGKPNQARAKLLAAFAMHCQLLNLDPKQTINLQHLDKQYRKISLNIHPDHGLLPSDPNMQEDALCGSSFVYGYKRLNEDLIFRYHKNRAEHFDAVTKAYLILKSMYPLYIAPTSFEEEEILEAGIQTGKKLQYQFHLPEETIRCLLEAEKVNSKDPTDLINAVLNGYPLPTATICLLVKEKRIELEDDQYRYCMHALQCLRKTLIAELIPLEKKYEEIGIFIRDVRGDMSTLIGRKREIIIAIDRLMARKNRKQEERNLEKATTKQAIDEKKREAARLKIKATLSCEAAIRRRIAAEQAHQAAEEELAKFLAEHKIITSAATDVDSSDIKSFEPPSNDNISNRTRDDAKNSSSSSTTSALADVPPQNLLSTKSITPTTQPHSQNKCNVLSLFNKQNNDAEISGFQISKSSLSLFEQSQYIISETRDDSYLIQPSKNKKSPTMFPQLNLKEKIKIHPSMTSIDDNYFIY